MTFWLVQALNGISYGMLLFLLASGLSLIFGVMKILNLTHGSFYLLGGYLGLVVLQETGSFILAVLGASLAIALIGVVMERFFLRNSIYNNCRRSSLPLVSFLYFPILQR